MTDPTTLEHTCGAARGIVPCLACDAATVRARIKPRCRVDAEQALDRLTATLKAQQGRIAELEQRLAREARPVASGWIRCEERMPEDTERIWLFCAAAVGNVLRGEYRSGQFYTSEMFAWDGGEVTHWMHRPVEPYRPAPPEEKA